MDPASLITPEGFTPAVEYCRVSPRPKIEGKEHDDRDSIPVQHERNQRYAALWNYHLRFRFEDPDSSATTFFQDRDVGKKVLDCFHEWDVHHLIVQRIDRLFRDTVDGLMQMIHWEKQGITVHFSDEGGNCINTSTAWGKRFFTMALADAAYWRDITAERTSTALLSYQRKGRRVSSQPCYGRMIDPIDPTRTLINDAEQRIIADIVALQKVGNGPYQIERLLNKDRVPARGKKWSAFAVKSILNRYWQDQEAAGLPSRLTG